MLLGSALVAAPMVVATAAAWILALAAEAGWEVVRESVVNNTVARTLGEAGKSFGSYGHVKPFWYYLSAVPVCLLPWSLAIPAAARSAVLRPSWHGGRTRFMALLVLTGVILLSIPSGKRSVYFLPLIPAAAAVLGVWASRIASSSGGRLDRATFRALAWAVAGGATAAGLVLLVVASTGVGGGKLAFLLASPTWHLVLAGAAALAGGAVFARIAVRARTLDWATVRAGMVAAVLAAVVASFVGRPLFDPAEEYRSGVLRAMAHLPEEGPLFGLDLGETERAVFAFYTGREFVQVESPEELKRLLDAGDVDSLIVDSERRTARFGRLVTARFDVAATVPMRPGDTVRILRLRSRDE